MSKVKINIFLHFIQFDFRVNVLRVFVKTKEFSLVGLVSAITSTIHLNVRAVDVFITRRMEIQFVIVPSDNIPFRTAQKTIASLYSLEVMT